jgi:hypothetical protein
MVIRLLLFQKFPLRPPFAIPFALPFALLRRHVPDTIPFEVPFALLRRHACPPFAMPNTIEFAILRRRAQRALLIASSFTLLGCHIRGATSPPLANPLPLSFPVLTLCPTSLLAQPFALLGCHVRDATSLTQPFALLGRHVRETRSTPFAILRRRTATAVPFQNLRPLLRRAIGFAFAHSSLRVADNLRFNERRNLGNNLRYEVDGCNSSFGSMPSQLLCFDNGRLSTAGRLKHKPGACRVL